MDTTPSYETTQDPATGAEDTPRSAATDEETTTDGQTAPAEHDEQSTNGGAATPPGGGELVSGTLASSGITYNGTLRVTVGHAPTGGPSQPDGGGATPGGPTPGRPTPGRPTPGRPTPAEVPAATPVPAGSAVAAGRGPEPTPAELAAAGGFGRVDDDGTVHVLTHAGDRVVGTWAAGEPDAALAFFVRRYLALQADVALAETRLRSGSLSADDAGKTVRRLRGAVESAQAVGDLDALAVRVDALDGLVAVAREQSRAERAAAIEAARERKTALVADAEQIAAGQNWRVGQDRLRVLFEEWKTLPRLDRATDDELWKRFSAARTTYTRRRKSHYSELTASRDTVRTAKEELITEAEGLAGSTDWGPTTARHRVLMDRWKAAGTAAKDVDDALWERFRTARQAFFEAREAHDSERTSTERANLGAREQVLAEAEGLLPVGDLKAARRAMRPLRERWAAIGHVPRSAIAPTEARFKVVEDAVRGAEQTEWRRTDPEAVRRARRTAEQLRPALERLERELDSARDRGDAPAVTAAQEAITARRQWLEQADRIIAESS